MLESLYIYYIEYFIHHYFIFNMSLSYIIKFVVSTTFWVSFLTLIELIVGERFDVTIDRHINAVIDI